MSYHSFLLEAPDPDFAPHPSLSPGILLKQAIHWESAIMSLPLTEFLSSWPGHSCFVLHLETRLDLCSDSTSSHELSAHFLWMMQFELIATTLRVSLQVRKVPIVLVLTVPPLPLASPEALVGGLKRPHSKSGFGFILTLSATSFWNSAMRISMQTNHSH